MTDKVLVPPIESQEELYTRRQLLTNLKVTQATMESVTNSEKTLTDSLHAQSNQSFIRIQAFIRWLENQEFIGFESHSDAIDTPIQLTPKFYAYMRRLKATITIAEKNEKIMSPFSFYGKKFSGSANSVER